MTLINFLLFWAATCLSIIALYKAHLYRRLEGERAKGDAQLVAPRELRLSPQTLHLALILITVVALAVRLYRFGAVPGGFNQDGAMAAIDAKALADHGTDRLGMRYPVHLTAWGFGQMSALLSYLMAPLIRLFGLNSVTARLPLLLVSLAGLWCFYRLVRNTFGEVAGVVAYAFAAIDPWHILQSRWALDCNLFPHFFLFGTYLLTLALQSPRRKGWLCGSMACFGLCMYCYGVSIYTVPLFLLCACLWLLKTKRVSWGEAGLALGAYLLVAWPFIATMAINTFGWPSIETPLFTIPFFPDSVRSKDILFFSDDIPGQLVTNLTALSRTTLLQSKDLPWNDVAGFGTMYLVSMPFAVPGAYSLLERCRKAPGAVLMALFLLTGIWCGVTTNSVNVNRINLIYYPIMLLIALGICQVLRFISLPRLAVGVGAGYLLLFGLFTHTYFTTYAQEVAPSFFQDFTQAVASLEDSDAQRLYITPDGARNSGYIAELLTLFYHEVDAEYYQGKTTPPGQPPYRERYHYTAVEDLPFDRGEDAAYLIPARALDAAMASLPAEEYRYTAFGTLYTVEKN